MQKRGRDPGEITTLVLAGQLGCVFQRFQRVCDDGADIVALVDMINQVFARMAVPYRLRPINR